MSGATGAVYAVRLLEQLRAIEGVESHLVMSAAARRTLVEETDLAPRDVEALADVVHDNRDVGAPLASGSFRTMGMVIVPCSVKTLGAVTHSYTSTLLTRAADVTLKEGRPLLAVFRETPLHAGHLRTMLRFVEMGGVLLPPMPAFYHRPKTVEQVVDHTVARLLDRLGLPQSLVPEWTGHAPRKDAP